MINIADKLTEKKLNEITELHRSYLEKTIRENLLALCAAKKVKRTVKVEVINCCYRFFDEEIPPGLEKNLAKSLANEDFIMKLVEKCFDPNLKALDDRFHNYINNCGLNDTRKKQVKNQLTKIMSYDKFVKGTDINGKRWGRNELLHILDVSVCPYCNRQYISKFTESDGKGRKRSTATIDHYITKGKSPLLALNIYNMIPACSVCNSILKGRGNTDDSESTSELHLNPYQDPTCLQFELNDSDKTEKPGITITPQCTDAEVCKRAENSINTFKLNEIYSQNHLKEAERIRNDVLHYTDEYLKKILNPVLKDPSFLITMEDINNHIFYYLQQDETEVPLTKFRKDIYNQYKDKKL